MAENEPKITINKPSTHKRKQPMSLRGTAPPGTAVKVKPKWKGAQISTQSGLETRARDNGEWVMSNVRAPDAEGVFELEIEEQQSTESTPATTTTTFAVKGGKK